MGLSADVVADLRREIAPMLLCSGRNAVYVGIGHAADVVSWMAQRGFVVLGLEGFDCDGAHLFPRLECIADLSDAADGEVSVRQASGLLEAWRGRVQWIDIVIAPAARASVFPQT